MQGRERVLVALALPIKPQRRIKLPLGLARCIPATMTPQAMIVKVRGRRIPGRLLAGSIYLSWLVVSAFLAWLVVG